MPFLDKDNLIQPFSVTWCCKDECTSKRGEKLSKEYITVKKRNRNKNAKNRKKNKKNKIKRKRKKIKQIKKQKKGEKSKPTNQK